MRTEPPSPLASLSAWLRTSAGRARRWLAAQGASTRISLLLVALAGLGSVGYLASLDDPSELAPAWIFEGHQLSIDDVVAISDALDAEGIAHVADQAAGKVGVKPARKAEALAALGKHKISPRTLEDLAHEDPPSLWDSLEDRQRRELATRERILNYEIKKLNPSIRSALVQILRTSTRPKLNAPSNVGVSVYLEVEGRRNLDHKTVDGIETFLKGNILDLNPKLITVADSNGTNYLSADNPEIREQLKTHAQEETWREQIAAELQHIPRVGVSVQLETVILPPPPSPPPAVKDNVVVTNGQVIIDPDPPVEPQPAPVQPTKTRAKVLVRVPRSFFLLDFAGRYPSRSPTPEDVEQMKDTTEKLIRDAVEIHIPRDELGVIKVVVIQDDLASPREFILPSATDPHRPWTWAALSTVVVLAGVGAVAGMVRLATRRQPARSSLSSMRAGYVAESPSGPLPGPSERVRELIRLNPEAAAGVLQRWIGQGGALP